MTQCQIQTPGRPQRIAVFQQGGSAETKIAGMRKYGEGRVDITVVSIETDLPAIIEDGAEFLPRQIEADLVLDYLTHPDLSHDLGALCMRLGIPVVASGKKSRTDRRVFTPPT